MKPKTAFLLKNSIVTGLICSIVIIILLQMDNSFITPKDTWIQLSTWIPICFIMGYGISEVKWRFKNRHSGE
ncbi:hypothetical protein SK066_22500 [Paenibacillus hunanensis]|uniref:hypothetical protein n=1 Tax=Paenibacillus hunanensis TaxID=539262 RepID=UPI002A69B991|nr:hypothetical protein [Paenibacillus hunanensis]WPP41290.1 hypothetical protein SK066_22500 [Paenibacillus hunanensis]